MVVVEIFTRSVHGPIHDVGICLVKPSHFWIIMVCFQQVVNMVSVSRCSCGQAAVLTEGVYLGRIETFRSHAIQLCYDLGKKVGVLVTHGHVPEMHLQELELQLLEAISNFNSAAPDASAKLTRSPMSLSVVNEHPVILSGPQLLFDLIYQVDHGDQLAIDFRNANWNSTQLSYADLDEKSGQLADEICASLNDIHPSSQPIIALYMPQSADLYITMLAVLKAGGAFCPLQLDAPPDRLRYVITDLSASLIITTRCLEAKISSLTESTCLVINSENILPKSGSAVRPRETMASDYAYIMYTSGSTGKPKGVPISHLAITQTLLAHDKHIPEFSRFLQFAAPTFDVSLFEIFFTLFRGGTLVGCERSMMLADLPDAMRRMEVDAAELTPTVAAGLLGKRANVPSLKLLLTIGEMLTPRVVEEFGDYSTHESILWGMYGPTEATIHCTIQTAFSSKLRTTIIGAPFESVSAFVIGAANRDDQDRDIRILPVGHVGELAVGGHQLASGYLNRDEQTAKAFVTTISHGRIYRTGDKARLLPDGSIECLGRISAGQVKLRGQRIESGEIQYAATRARGCRDAVASVIHEKLVVFCLVQGEDATIQEILSVCRQWLPEFMVPADIIVMSEYPCLPSGKVDKARLDNIYTQSKSAVATETVDPRDDEMKEVYDILGRNAGHRIGSTTILASSGIDSLSAIRIAAELRHSGYEVSPMDLLNSNSAGDLLQTMRNKTNGTGYYAEGSTSEDATIDLQDLAMANPLVQQFGKDIVRISACTPIQISMLAETVKDSRSYCNTVDIAFPRNSHVEDIAEAVQVLVAHNEILRSGFCRLISSEHPFALITWETLDCSQIKITNELAERQSIEKEFDFIRPAQFEILKSSSESTSSPLLRMSLHHALYDGWSLELIADDLDHWIKHRYSKKRPQFDKVSSYYRRSDPLPSSQYWQEHLSGYQPAIMPNYNGYVLDTDPIQSQDFNFSIALSTLRTSAERYCLSPQSFFQSAVAYVIGLYLGASDVSIGVVTSGRTIDVSGIENIIGPCMISLPLRINVSHSKRSIDLLRQIHKLNRQLLRNSDLPLRLIKRACNFDASTNLWDVLFVWQETLNTQYCQNRDVTILNNSDRLESILTIEVEPRGDTLRGKATFRAARFPASQVNLLFKQVDALVQLFTERVDTPLADLPSKLPHTILSIANSEPTIPEFDFGICAMVEKRAKSNPNAPAVEFTPDHHHGLTYSLTYAELNSQANQLARASGQRLGALDELVCICMEKSLNLYIAILAVLKTGRGYLPITPSTPQNRVCAVLQEAKIGVCISETETISSLNLGRHSFVLDMSQVELNQYSDDNLDLPYIGNQPAYAVFTSGSTGKPKGVVVTQQNLMSNIKVLSSLYPNSPHDRFLQACSQAFDVSVFEIFFTWSSGMCLCSATNDALFADLEECIRNLRITHLSLTPTVATLVNPKNTPTVRFLVTAGEAVTEKVKRMWSGHGLYQGYGPSETTNICSVKEKVLVSDLINNIGPPLSNTSCIVFNPDTEDILPAGAVGELCFGGDQVFRGYLNDPELTASKMIHHAKYGQLYRSGDAGRLLPNNCILFAGRLDDQVKIRGQRVELGEVNFHIIQAEHILDCATVVLYDPNTGSPILVSFWIPESHNSIRPEIVPITDDIAKSIVVTFDDLIAALPAYMVPNALIPMSAIPMTNQAKIDKRKLQEMFEEMDADFLEATGQRVEDSKDLDDWSNLEQAIAKCLTQVVQMPLAAVKRHSSFFTMGLDSISAISFSKAMCNQCRCTVKVSTILRHPSVARLAKELELKGIEGEEPRVKLSEVFDAGFADGIQNQFINAGAQGPVKLLPCTALQEAMLSASTTRSSALYCNTMIFSVHGDLSMLQNCWKEMVERHEMLRTCFVTTKSVTYPFAQVVLVNHTVDWIYQETTTSITDTAKAIVKARLSGPLDSLRPAYLLAVVRRGRSRYLQFSCHHALQDGTATGNLTREIEALYSGKHLLPPISAESFLEEMINHRSQSAMRFWTRRLEGFRPTVVKTHGEKHLSYTQPLELPLSELERASQLSSVSLLALTQTAWCKMLYSLTGDLDICFGNVVSGRVMDISDLDHLVAPTFNTVPVRVDFSRQQSNDDVLAHVQKFNSDSLTRQLTPLRSIQSQLGLSGIGLFSTLLILQQHKLGQDTKIWTLEFEFGEMDFPIILELIPNRADDTLFFVMHFESFLFSPDEQQEVFDIFTNALLSCVKYPATAATDFDRFSNHTIEAFRPKISRPSFVSTKPATNKNSERSLTLAQEELQNILAEFSGNPLRPLNSSTTIHQLGLDSISAIQLASRVRELKGVDISAADILANPSIAALADMIEARKNVDERKCSFNFGSFDAKHRRNVCRHNGRLRTERIELVRPCTPLQNGLITQFLRARNLYVNHMSYLLDDSWTTHKLQQAWISAFARFPMLRAGFVSLSDSSLPFGMLIHSELDYAQHFTVASDSVDVDKWRLRQTERFHKYLEDPPWAVLIVETQGRLLMHLTMFHALYDAYSLRLILEYLYLGEDQRSNTSEKTFDPLLDHILGSSQTEKNSSDEETRSLFWKRAFTDISINKFPNLTPLFSTTSMTAVNSRIFIKSTHELETACTQVGITLQAAGQAAWARLLSAYIGESNVTFGVVLSGRDGFPGAEEIAFPCITTIPVLAMHTNDNWRLLTDMMTFNSSIRKHQFTPIKDVQRWTGHQNQPLFDTIFAFQKTSIPQTARKWKVVEDVASVEYAISVELEPQESGQLLLRISYDLDLLPKEQANILLNQFDTIMTDLVTCPHGNQDTDLAWQNVDLFSVVSAKCPVIPSPVQLLHQFVELRAGMHPDRIAFRFATSISSDATKEQCWTYKELDEEGNLIAHFLHGQGIHPGSVIGICFDKCPEASFAILGVLKAGCAYVAIDPGAPPARKAFIVRDSGAKLVLTSNGSMDDRTAPESVHGRCDEATHSITHDILRVPVIDLNEMSVEGLPRSKRDICPDQNPGSTCYCLYTSGTTGTPKGCEITHENAVQAMLAFSRLFTPRWNDKSRWLQFASFHFDVSVLEQYWSWSEGICVVSAPRDLIFEDLAGAIRALKITHIDLTPSLASLIRPEEVPSLCDGVFITGGEQLKQEILDVWGPSGVIHNGYGPTEATIGVIMYTGVPQNGKPSNIGRQFDNVGTYVLRTNHDIPVLRGGVGELCLSGKLVGKGYLNRDDLTKEKFPFLDRFGERIYRTGDLVRLLWDGSFIFIGRADDQVKLRGQRLEIGEIDTTIRQAVPDIVDIATYVLKHPKQQRDQLITFFVVSNETERMAKARILQNDKTHEVIIQAQDACHAKLPTYMIPTHFVPLTKLPLSTNNKTDSNALRQLYDETSFEVLQGLSSANGKDVSLSSTELQVAKVIAKVLSIEFKDIQSTSNIFELGMDSILVIAFTQALKSANFSSAQPSLILTHGTIKSLSKALETGTEVYSNKSAILNAQQAISACFHRYRAKAARTLDVASKDIQAIAPCTPLQAGMISKSLETNEPIYFATFRYALSSDVDLQRLRGAWATALEQVQILRTKFVPMEEGYVQAVLRVIELPWNDDTLAVDGNQDKVWSAQTTQGRLNRCTLLRPFEVSIIESSEQRHMILNIFHALYDGQSLALLLSLIRKLYDGRENADAGPAFHYVLPYGPLLANLDAKRFWTGQLTADGVAPLQPPGRQDEMHAGIAKVAVTFDDLGNFESVRRKLNVSPQAMIQACFAAVMNKYAAGRISLGLVISGRTIDFENAEQVIGPMFNTIPFQLVIAQQDTWRTIVQRCHKFNTESLPYQHTPLRDIQRWCKIQPETRLFDMLFVFERETEEKAKAESSSIWTLVDDQSVTDYSLAFEAELKLDGRLVVSIVAQGDIADETGLKKLADEFHKAIIALIHDANALVSNTVGNIPTWTPMDGPKADTSEDATVVQSTKHFVWTQKANSIRQELSTLSGISTDEITADVSIFELGLDSIDTIKISSRLSKLGLNLPVSSIMRHPTIRKLVGIITPESMTQTEEAPSLIGKWETRLKTILLDSEKDEVILPTTPLQEAMVAEMVSSGYHRYYNHDVLRLSADIKVDKLRSAWQIVFEHSDILQTTFKSVSEPSIPCSFAQIIHKFEQLPWYEVFNFGMDDVDKLLDKIRDEAVRGTSQASHLRLTLCQTSSERYLILSIPHALYDGWSLGLLHHDVQKAYHDQFITRPSNRAILEDILQGLSHEATEFWSDYLSGAQPCLFQSMNRTTKPMVHRKEQASSIALLTLRKLCKSQGITMQTLGQAVWSLVLASYTHSLEVLFGVILSGRDTEASQQALFPTMNTIAFRQFIHGSSGDILRNTQEDMSRIRQYQHFPLRKAQRLTNSNGGRLFDSLFLYQVRPEFESAEGEALYESVGGNADVEYPVCVEMEGVGEELIWRVACEDTVLDEQGTSELLNHINTTLKKCVEEVDINVIDFDGDEVRVGKLPPFRITQPSHDEDTQSSLDESKDEIQEFSDLEEKIRKVLSTVSGTPEEDIGKRSTLFHIGLDSISAIKVSALLRKKDIILSVSNMLKASTLGGMARFVNNQKGAKSTNAAIASEPTSISTVRFDISKLLEQSGLRAHGVEEQHVQSVFPAASGQVYMLSTWENSYSRLFYDEFKFSVHSTASFQDIHRGWNNLVSTHPILRTCFITAQDEKQPFLQVVLRASNEKQQVINRDDESGILAAVDCLNSNLNEKAELRQPFVSLRYNKNGEGEWDFGLKIHHALYDGVSLPALLSDLRTSIESPTTELDDTRPSNDAFSAFAQQAYASRNSGAARAFWTQYLSSVTHDNAATVDTERLSGSRISNYKPKLTPQAQGLVSFAQRNGISLPSLFLSIYARLHATHKGNKSSTTIIGVYIANRSDTHGEDLATSPTVNLLPLKIDIQGGILVSAKQIQSDLARISDVENVNVGLWQIERWTRVKVGTFVNYLRLPGEGDGDGFRRDVRVDEKEIRGGGNVMGAGSDDMKQDDETKRNDGEETSETFAVPSELMGNTVKNVYVPSIDVEVALRDGALDVGIFAPIELMSEEQAEEMMANLHDQLMALVREK
ncbi:hypothetical protein EJ08DRAFT_475481 [Tothia fuscella]|uniref:Carrier domain-containing protein n=1 Tax=Tothia fuscella TaxID=1048955 RepID=A0A9P4NIB6_9PEZI|nr:hypothetical protein EJ08DRAFT_475481 [Tothia fuscella]